MTGRWAATNTLREALAISWPEGDHAEPNVFTEALAALALVEAALDAAERFVETTDRAPIPLAPFQAIPWDEFAAALRAVRESVMTGVDEDAHSAMVRAEAAEARCARLQQALAHALDCKGSFNGTVSERGGYPAICTDCEAEAREALAGTDT